MIDTAGAALTPEAEEGGLAGEIARCLADLMALPVPTLSVLLGQGAGGAAIALLPADRILATQHSWLGPLPPEGAAMIQNDDPARTATAQGVRSQDLHRSGAVDRLIPERPDAADEPRAFARRLVAVVDEELHTLLSAPCPGPQPDRAARFRALGLPQLPIC
jgi:acetyl-CoA carboxylase carboxyl transferase subunit beta